MNRAEQQAVALATGAMDYLELLEEACLTGDVCDQDIDNECTWFELGDGSVALFNCGDQSITAYGSK